MKIESGKYYKSRGGEERGPIGRYSHPMSNGADFTDGVLTYFLDGKWGGTKEESPRDLVSEARKYASGPIRTVIRKEIVGGTYGIVHLGTAYNTTTGVTKPVVSISMSENYTAEELHDAASVLTELAENLEE